MLEGFFKFFKELDRRVNVTIINTGIYNWSKSLPMQYNQLYTRDLGANPVELGLLNIISEAASSTFSIPIGWTCIHAIMPTENLSREEGQEELYKCYRGFYGSFKRRVKGFCAPNIFNRRTYRYSASQSIFKDLRELF